MPPADAALAPAGQVPLAKVSLSGWGGGSRSSVLIGCPRERAQLSEALADWRRLGLADRGAIARGMGRSYGDAAQLDGGLVVDLTRLKRVELDPGSGIVTADAGVTVAEL